MTILYESRALLALLQPLTGDRANGSVLVQSTDATGIIPANSHACPIIAGQMRSDLLFKTAVNPATNNGSWPVVQGGTPVPILSVLGGAQHNIVGSTVLRWFPSIDGIAPTAAVSATGLSDGAPNTSLVGVADAKLFEQLVASPGAGVDMFKSGLSAFPGLILVWQGSEPDDGMREQPLGPRVSRLGRGATLQRSTWDLFIVASRLDSDPARREQGMVILDEIREIITDRQTVDGMVFSCIRGLSVHKCGRHVIDPKFYVYLITFSTCNVLQQREYRDYSDWAKTRLDVTTTDSSPFVLVRDNESTMP